MSPTYKDRYLVLKKIRTILYSNSSQIVSFSFHDKIIYNLLLKENFIVGSKFDLDALDSSNVDSVLSNVPEVKTLTDEGNIFLKNYEKNIFLRIEYWFEDYPSFLGGLLGSLLGLILPHTLNIFKNLFEKLFFLLKTIFGYICNNVF